MDNTGIVQVEGGYKVCKHKNGHSKCFINPAQSDEKKLYRAKKYIDFLNNLEEPCKKEEKILYLQVTKNGYRVKRPGYKTKYFVSKLVANEENKRLALEYLNSLEKKN